MLLHAGAPAYSWPRMQASATTNSHRRRCGWFWAWVTVGALGALGAISLGLIALAPALLIATLISMNEKAGQPAFGLVSGAGLPLLFVAYLNREGPGITCYRTASSAGCDQHLNPLPWLVIGLLLLAAGCIAQARRA